MTPPITSVCHSAHPCPGELALDAPRLRRQATLLVAGDPVVDALAANQEPPGHLDHLPPGPTGQRRTLASTYHFHHALHLSKHLRDAPLDTYADDLAQL